VEVLKWFGSRLHTNPQLLPEEFCTYISIVTMLSKDDHQIQMVQSESEMLSAILTYFRETDSEPCMNGVLKLLAMLFRGIDELSLEIFRKYRNLFDYLNEKVGRHGHEVTAWCLYAASNMCANGKEIIAEALNCEFVTAGTHIYEEGNEIVRRELLHLLWVMFERGGDRQRMLLYENNLLLVVVEELQNESNPEVLLHCLKCLRWLMNSAVKMTNLELKYTSIIKNDLERRPGLRARLE